MLSPDLTLTIDLSAIAENYRILQRHAPKAECAAVVKANAYGLGIEKVAPTLKAAGCEFFFVATLEEAIALRTLLPRVKIAWFHGPSHKDHIALATEHHLIPVINTVESLHWVEELPYILHIDTGMNRLGISQQDLAKIPHQLVNALYIMTHAACADEAENPMNQVQYTMFKAYVGQYSQIKASYANSYAMFMGSQYHFDLVRPGCALYGINPTPLLPNPMQAVVTLMARILQIRHIDTPSSVGYGATQEVRAGSVLATVACGYADGYLRAAGGKGYGAIGGMKFPIVGRISMDLLVLDITSAKVPAVAGDMIELIGPTLNIDDVAKNAGTIGYEILTRLGDRHHRIYQ